MRYRAYYVGFWYRGRADDPRRDTEEREEQIRHAPESKAAAPKSPDFEDLRQTRLRSEPWYRRASIPTRLPLPFLLATSRLHRSARLQSIFACHVHRVGSAGRALVRSTRRSYVPN